MKKKHLLIPLLTSFLVLSSCSLGKHDLNKPGDNINQNDKEDSENTNPEIDDNTNKDPDNEGEVETKKGTISFAPTTNGSVKINELQRTFDIGTIITLVINPNDGFEIDVVKQNQTIINKVNNSYSIIVVEGENLISVTFKAKTPESGGEVETKKGTIVIDTLTNGAVSVSNIKESYEVDDEVTLNVTPDRGYKIKEVKQNDILIEPINNVYKIKIVEGENLISATFEKVSEYEETSIFDLASSAEAYYKYQTPSKFHNKKVKIRGTVVGYVNHQLFLQEGRFNSLSNSYEYKNILIFCGMSDIPNIYKEFGTILEINAKFSASENFGCQLTDVNGGFPRVPSDEIDNTKIIKAASENINDKLNEPQVFKINEFDGFNDIMISYLNQKVEFKGDFKVIDVNESHSNNNLNLKLKSVDNPNFVTSVYLSFVYKPYLNNPNFNVSEQQNQTIFRTKEDFLNKIFGLRGILTYKVSNSNSSYNNSYFQVEPTSNLDLILGGIKEVGVPEIPVKQGTIQDEVVTIDVLGAFSQDKINKLQTQVDQFREVEPNIRVNLKSGGSYDETHSQTMSAYLKDEHADIVYEHNESIAEYVSNDIAYNIEDYVNNSSYGLSKEDKEDFIPTYLETGTKFDRKGTYSMPYQVTTDVMTYNGGLLLGKTIKNINNNLPLDKTYFETLTWEKFFDEFCPNIIDYKLDNGEYLINRENRDYSVLAISGDSSFFYTLASELNSPITSFDPSKGETSYTFNNEKMKTLYQKLSEYKEKHYITTKGLINEYPNNLVNTRSALCSIETISGLRFHNSAYNLEVCEIPKFEGLESKSMLYTNSFSFLKHKKADGSLDTNRILASWLFYKYIMDFNNCRYRAITTNTLPLRKSVLENDTYKKLINDSITNHDDYYLINKAIKMYNNKKDLSSLTSFPLFEKSDKLYEVLCNLSIECLKAKGEIVIINNRFEEAELLLNH